jgi:hypothetical protein
VVLADDMGSAATVAANRSAWSFFRSLRLCGNAPFRTVDGVVRRARLRPFGDVLWLLASPTALLFSERPRTPDRQQR